MASFILLIILSLAIREVRHETLRVWQNQTAAVLNQQAFMLESSQNRCYHFPCGTHKISDFLMGKPKPDSHSGRNALSVGLRQVEQQLCDTGRNIEKQQVTYRGLDAPHSQTHKFIYGEHHVLAGANHFEKRLA